MTTTPAGRVSRESVREMIATFAQYAEGDAVVACNRLTFALDQLPDAELPAIGGSDALRAALTKIRDANDQYVKHHGCAGMYLRKELREEIDAALRPSGEDRG